MKNVGMSEKAFKKKDMPLTLALYEPEIPQNTGTLLRLAACMGLKMDIIEPCGFVWNHPSFKRSVMDYIDHVFCTRHVDFDNFVKSRPGRTIAVVVDGKNSLYDFDFREADTLLFGKESSGIPSSLTATLPSIYIPMMGPVECRSLNLASAASIVMGEAIRQIMPSFTSCM